MVNIPAALMPHRVTLKAFVKEGPTGHLYATPKPARALVKMGAHLVRVGNGDQLTSMALVVLDPGNAIPPRSLVTFTNPLTGSEETREVLTVEYANVPGTPANVAAHLE